MVSIGKAVLESSSYCSYLPQLRCHGLSPGVPGHGRAIPEEAGWVLHVTFSYHHHAVSIFHYLRRVHVLAPGLPDYDRVLPEDGFLS